MRQLEAWTPPKPKADAKTGFHDLAYRYVIKNGVRVDPTVQPFDSDAKAEEVYVGRFGNGTEYVVVDGTCYLNGIGLPGTLGAGSCGSLAHDFDIWLEWGAGNIEWSALEGQEDAAERLLNAYCQDRPDACGPELRDQLANLDPQPVPVLVENGIGSALAKILRIGARVPALKNLAPKTGGWLPQSALNKLPDEWSAAVPNKSGTGFRFFGPNQNAQGVRIDKGDPTSPFPSQRVDHVIIRDGGRVIGRDGKPISGSIKDDPTNAHIPLSEWSKWSKWNTP